MFRLAVVALCLAVVYSAAVEKKVENKLTEEWEKPAFCNGNDCPVFEVLEQGDGYEVRRYPAATWVSTMYYANNPAEGDEKQGVAFNKLFNYIDGQNVNGELRSK